MHLTAKNCRIFHSIDLTYHFPHNFPKLFVKMHFHRMLWLQLVQFTVNVLKMMLLLLHNILLNLSMCVCKMEGDIQINSSIDCSIGGSICSVLFYSFYQLSYSWHNISKYIQNIQIQLFRWQHIAIRNVQLHKLLHIQLNICIDPIFDSNCKRFTITQRYLVSNCIFVYWISHTCVLRWYLCILLKQQC